MEELHLGAEDRLRALREEETRLRAQQRTDAITRQLQALEFDIAAAQDDLDDVIEASRERARRLDELRPPQGADEGEGA